MLNIVCVCVCVCMYVMVEPFLLDGCHSSPEAGNPTAETTTLGLKQIGLLLLRTDPAFQA
jgi:hypothetical protein